MKKYFKLFTVCLVSLCMVFTGMFNFSVRAEETNYPYNVKPGDDVAISYYGVNLNRYGKITETVTDLGTTNLEGKKIALPNDPKEDGLLINPTANISDLWGLKNYNKDVIYDSDHTAPGDWFDTFDTNKYFVDEYGQKNTYYGYVTEQTIDGVVYQLVGWRMIGSSVPSGFTTEKYLENYSNFQTYEEAEPYITFKHNQMIGYDDWEEAIRKRNEYYLNDGNDKTNPGPDNEINLVGVYIPKPEEPIDFGGGTYEYDGTSKWDVELPKLEETSTDLTSKVYVNEAGENVIQFTIPEGYDEDSIQLTLNDELVQLFAFHFGSAGADIEENGDSVTYAEDEEYERHKQVINKPGTIKDKEYYDILPGDVGRFKIEIINNSKNVYSYDEGSLDIRTPNLDFYRSSTEYPEYGESALDYTGTTMTGFDGQTMLSKFTPTRIKNESLYSLLGDEATSILVSDETLGSELNRLFKEDPQGIGNLNKYYLDYYNNEFSKNNSNFTPKTKIEDFTANQIREMFLDLEHSSMKRETNKEVAETLYNYFYNEVFGVAPSKDIPESGRLNTEYSIGNFMRNGNNSFEEYMTSLNVLPSQIDSEKEYSVEWAFKIDGPNCFNIYNNMDYGFDMGFKLEKKVGNVAVHKHIDFAEYESNDTPTFIFELTDANGDTYIKSMSFDEGQTDNTIVFENIPYGSYTVRELDSIRYEVVGSGEVSGEVDRDLIEVNFENKKEKDNDFSDSNVVINSFKKTDQGIVVNNDSQHNNDIREE